MAKPVWARLESNHALKKKVGMSMTVMTPQGSAPVVVTATKPSIFEGPGEEFRFSGVLEGFEAGKYYAENRSAGASVHIHEVNGVLRGLISRGNPCPEPPGPFVLRRRIFSRALHGNEIHETLAAEPRSMVTLGQAFVPLFRQGQAQPDGPLHVGGPWNTFPFEVNGMLFGLDIFSGGRGNCGWLVHGHPLTGNFKWPARTSLFTLVPKPAQPK